MNALVRACGGWVAVVLILAVGPAAWAGALLGSTVGGHVWLPPALILVALARHPGRRREPAAVLFAAVLVCLAGLLPVVAPVEALLLAVTNGAVAALGGAAVPFLRRRWGLRRRQPRDVLVVGAVCAPAGLLLAGLGGVPGVQAGHPDPVAYLQVTGSLIVGTLGLLPLLLPEPPRMRPSRRNLLALTVVAVVCAVVPTVTPHSDLTWIVLLPALWGGLTLNVAWAGAATALLAALVSGARLWASQDLPLVAGAAADPLLLAAAATLMFLLVLHRENTAALAIDLRAETRARAEERALLDEVVGAMSDGLVLLDEGRIVLANPAARLLLGDLRVGDRLAGRVHERFLTGDGDALTEDALAPLSNPAGASTRVGVASVPSAGTSPVHLELAVRAVPGSDGLAVVTVVDTTATLARRQELKTFAGRVAQDLTSPLSRVRRWIDVADTRLSSGLVNAGADALVKADTAGDHMRALIDDYLAYTVAREGVLRPVPTNLSDALAEVTPALSHDSDLAVIADLPHVVRADPDLLQRLVAHLIAEAAQYRPEGEAATVRLRSEETPGGWVTLEVTGVAPVGWNEEGASIFEGREDDVAGVGARLGFELCRSIVDRHGGRLESVTDAGVVTYTATLPSGHPRLESRPRSESVPTST